MTSQNDLILDVFNSDAFSLSTLTATINSLDHVPGQAGTVIFSSVGKGIDTLDATVESQGESLELIRTSPRGSAAEKEASSKRKVRKFHVPQIKLEDTIYAHELQNLRGEFNSEIIDNVMNRQLQKMVHRHDYTLEFHRLGALKGKIRDADGSVLLDLFQGFEILNSDGQPEPETFDFDLANPNADPRLTCHAIVRAMERAAKMTLPANRLVWAFCGDNFFDNLISHRNVKKAVAGIPPAAEKLSSNFAFGIYEFGGIIFENYRGSDDDSATIGIDPDEACFFFANVPGLYAEYFAPADFLDVVNTPGLPRYARLAFDKRFHQQAEIHTQQNPLPICLRPQTLMRGVANS